VVENRIELSVSVYTRIHATVCGEGLWIGWIQDRGGNIASVYTSVGGVAFTGTISVERQVARLLLNVYNTSRADTGLLTTPGLLSNSIPQSTEPSHNHTVSGRRFQAAATDDSPATQPRPHDIRRRCRLTTAQSRGLRCQLCVGGGGTAWCCGAGAARGGGDGFASQKKSPVPVPS
jgi:hypothetical protein